MPVLPQRLTAVDGEMAESILSQDKFETKTPPYLLLPIAYSPTLAVLPMYSASCCGFAAFFCLVPQN